MKKETNKQTDKQITLHYTTRKYKIQCTQSQILWLCFITANKLMGWADRQTDGQTNRTVKVAQEQRQNLKLASAKCKLTIDLL